MTYFYNDLKIYFSDIFSCGILMHLLVLFPLPMNELLSHKKYRLAERLLLFCLRGSFVLTREEQNTARSSSKIVAPMYETTYSFLIPICQSLRTLLDQSSLLSLRLSL